MVERLDRGARGRGRVDQRPGSLGDLRNDLEAGRHVDLGADLGGEDQGAFGQALLALREERQLVESIGDHALHDDRA